MGLVVHELRESDGRVVFRQALWPYESFHRDWVEPDGTYWAIYSRVPPPPPPPQPRKGLVRFFFGREEYDYEEDHDW